jgi:hypothetical protein
MPFVGGYLKIIYALINVYHKREILDKANEGRWATQMFKLCDKENELHTLLKRMENDKKKPQWKKYDTEMVCFPIFDKGGVQNICVGNFPLIYIEHIHQHLYL